VNTIGVEDSNVPLEFRGGVPGALVPMGIFLGGVAWLGLSGAPDERGFWPILLAALAAGLALARGRAEYADRVIRSMARPIVMVMVLAWLLAGVLGEVIGEAGFIPALVGIVKLTGIEGAAFVATAFVITSLVSTATGTSLGTILVCGPLLYPAGGSLGGDPAMLAGAILAGATFGDNISPVSDTTIASAATQQADIGGVVRSRVRYALPAAAVSLVLYALLAGAPPLGSAAAVPDADPSWTALWIVLGPAVTVGVLLARRHLLEGLLAGIGVSVIVALILGLLTPRDLMGIDREHFIARGVILNGMERGVGVSIFTLLLMGVVGGVEASGVTGRTLDALRGEDRAASPRSVEVRLFASVSGAVILTTHSVVAILAVGDVARQAGQSVGLSKYRIANLLDTTVCTYPFLLPFFIPTILTASVTGSGAEFGMPRLSAWSAGVHNFHSWLLLLVVILAIATGFGREKRT
jgi:Na+/H+ antiporter NhaC